MRITYTQKGLELRNKLKQEIFERGRETLPNKFDQSKRSNESIHFGGFTSLPRNGHNGNDKSLKLPGFETIKVELIKTPKGEIKEKPVLLTKELSNTDRYEITEINLNENNSSILQNLLNEKPMHLHK